MLVVADLDSTVGKRYREPLEADTTAVQYVADALVAEPAFGPGLPAVPAERLDPSLSGLIGPAGYGYQTWGALCNARQTLGFVRLARIIDDMCHEMLKRGAQR